MEQDAKRRQILIKAVIAFIVVMFVIILVVVINSKISNSTKISQGYIYVDNPDKFVGNHYQKVVKQLEAMGFENVETDDLNDAGIYSNNPDEVDNVTFNGIEAGESGGYHHKSDAVVVHYH